MAPTTHGSTEDKADCMVLLESGQEWEARIRFAGCGAVDCEQDGGV
jgi:hypothetical protein